jgi:hypothetical protein
VRVIHSLVATVFYDGCANWVADVSSTSSQVVRSHWPFSTFDCTFQGVEDSLRVIDLVNGGWPSGAIVSVVSLVSLVSFVADVSFIRVRAGQALQTGIPATLVRGMYRAGQAPIHLT